MASKNRTTGRASPPPRRHEPIIHGSPDIGRWLAWYWQKLQLPAHELTRLAITQDRGEFMRWTGKRLHSMALGCYCYISSPPQKPHRVPRPPRTPELSLPGLDDAAPPLLIGHRHLIFIEPDLQPRSLEVTVAHELIHLSDRVHGTPRRHRHHGYDSIAADEAAITGYDLDELRRFLHEESARLEARRRAVRPIRYLYQCPHCGKHYPRTRRYSHPVSCSQCDSTYNPRYRLILGEPFSA